jgi:4-hydroxybenzoate polyprenyltransferase
LKREAAALAPLDPATLPYEESLLRYLGEERARGSRIVLATAADRSVAERINLHLALFHEVIASDGANNLKGDAKGEALVKAFGEGGFTYVGNGSPDLAVWQRAGRGVVVNASPSVERRARQTTAVELAIQTRRPWWRSLLSAMRPYQWAKNALVFVPVVTASAFTEWSAWIGAAGAFGALSLTASAFYLINDVTDLEADRRHPRKRARPFARGDLSIVAALVAAPTLLAGGLLLATLSGTLALVVLYAVVATTYSFWLKELPLVDVFVLATLFTLRVICGGEASGHRVSAWLLAFSVFLFLSLALMKRVSELGSLGSRVDRAMTRRGYTPSDLAVLQAMGIASSFVSAMVLALFVNSQSISPRYERPELLWAIVFLLLFWECRVWLATGRGHMHDDPIVFAAKDWVSWLSAAVIVAIFVAARGAH